MPEPVVRLAAAGDSESLAAIYNHYVESTIVTFEEQAVTPAVMLERIAAVQAARLPWYVATENGDTVGYSYASPWKARQAYRFSAEVTIYVAPTCGGRGLGTRLYGELLGALKSSGMHAAIGGIALPNEPSVRLHEKCGFRKVAHFAEVGFKFGRWIDVGYWENLL